MADILVGRSDLARAWRERLVDVGDGSHAPAVAILRSAVLVTPAMQETVDAWAVVAGSELDTLHYGSLSYTILNSDAANGLNWRVVASNDVAFAVEVEVQASALVAAAGTDEYAVAQAPYRYYAVEVQSAVPGDHAEAVVAGLAKA